MNPYTVYTGASGGDMLTRSSHVVFVTTKGGKALSRELRLSCGTWRRSFDNAGNPTGPWRFTRKASK